MADQEFSRSPESENDGTDENKSQEVETWHPHPRHHPITPYEMFRNPVLAERRRPENAGIRRWMDLGDQALNSQQDSQEEEQDSQKEKEDPTA